MYGLLADLVILIHLAWVLFLVFGIFFVIRRPRIIFLHLSGLIFSLVLNLGGWYCPLTHLEDHLLFHHDSGLIHSGPFLIRYLGRLVYPSLPEHVVRWGEIVFVCVSIIAYICLLGKKGFLDRIRRGSP